MEDRCEPGGRCHPVCDRWLRRHDGRYDLQREDHGSREVQLERRTEDRVQRGGCHGLRRGGAWYCWSVWDALDLGRDHPAVLPGQDDQHRVPGSQVRDRRAGGLRVWRVHDCSVCACCRRHLHEGGGRGGRPGREGGVQHPRGRPKEPRCGCRQRRRQRRGRGRHGCGPVRVVRGVDHCLGHAVQQRCAAGAAVLGGGLRCPRGGDRVPRGPHQGGSVPEAAAALAPLRDPCGLRPGDRLLRVLLLVHPRERPVLRRGRLEGLCVHLHRPGGWHSDRPDDRGVHVLRLRPHRVHCEGRDPGPRPRHHPGPWHRDAVLRAPDAHHRCHPAGLQRPAQLVRDRDRRRRYAVHPGGDPCHRRVRAHRGQRGRDRRDGRVPQGGA
mmetsp:Transcript_88977/g.154304  ORF Transcript_88977/g.154304 Transcript_88977/m.154304 type:complete len:381 (-) Transcript_88977:1170-2312(-)